MGRHDSGTATTSNRRSHQCLSAGSPLGTKAKADAEIAQAKGHQCLSAGSPLGTRNELPPTQIPPKFVTNAFRRGVHLGHANEEVSSSYGYLSSPMPFGGESTWDPVAPVRLDPIPSGGHQCLSAGSPLGTLAARGNARHHPMVTNAFRRGVHLGQKVAPTYGEAVQSHQCLSAGSPLGTDGLGSSDPFETRSSHQCLSAGSPLGTKEINELTQSQQQLGHQCLSAGSPLGTH